jgi:hypothetical protein
LDGRLIFTLRNRRGVEFTLSGETVERVVSAVKNGDVVEIGHVFGCLRGVEIDRRGERHFPITGTLAALGAYALDYGLGIGCHLVGIGADDAVEVDPLRQLGVVVALERFDLEELDLRAVADLFR